MKYLLALLFLNGCATHHFVPVPPAVPTETVAMEPAMERAVKSLRDHGYAVKIIPPQEAYAVTFLPEDGEVKGTPCFFLDTVADPSVVSAAVTGTINGRKCVQGYTDVLSYPARVSMIDGAVIDHELKHLLFYYNYPSVPCPDNLGFEYQWIEHGAKPSGIVCDPFLLSVNTI